MGVIVGVPSKRYATDNLEDAGQIYPMRTNMWYATHILVISGVQLFRYATDIFD